MVNSYNDILKQTTVLFVEDEDDVRDHVKKILSMAVKSVLTARNGLEGLEVFKANQEEIDLIVTDINMPKMDGLEMSERIKDISNTTPIIIATAYNDPNFLHKAITLGIVGYIMKPIDLFQMTIAIGRAVEPQILRKRLMIKNAELEELNKTLEEKVAIRTKELEYLATMDSLTDINNRRNFFKLGTQKLNNAIANKDEFFAIMMDIDNFKNVNDTYGHAIGDEVIKSLTSTVSKNIEESDIFGRLGGEEFAILISAHPQAEVMTKIEELRKKIEKLVVSLDDFEVRFTMSTGVAQLHAGETSLDAILARADQALYDAKNEGKNRVKFRV